MMYDDCKTQPKFITEPVTGYSYRHCLKCVSFLQGGQGKDWQAEVT